MAYYAARLGGRHRKLLLALLIAPFWISYMMRMLAWVNLLQDDGLVNRALRARPGCDAVAVDWLDGRGLVVVLGLVYGYVPYMILPLYAGLDRLPTHVLEAARDLGAGRLDTFRRVTLPLSLPGRHRPACCSPACRCWATTSPPTCCRARRGRRWSAT